jgi:hypothetical protein
VKTMFSLSDEQLDRVIAAAAMLPASRRDMFLRSVAGRVAGLPCVGMAEIESAISFVLNTYGIGGGPRAFTRPKQKGYAR